MGLNNVARALMLDAFASQATWASLHTADPGDTGTGEVTGGSPAYARQAVAWTPAAASSIQSADPVVFDVPGGTTITHRGHWSATTGGTFLGSRPLLSSPFGVPAPVTFATQGTYTIAAGHAVESLA